MLIYEKIAPLLKERLKEKNPLIQVLLGPRQVGKTTCLQHLVLNKKEQFLYASADESMPHSTFWIQEKWNEAISISPDATLVIDEIQKIPNWSEMIKKLWDEQKIKKKTHLKLILSGSSSLYIQKGLSESLAGRFELIRAYHWGFEEAHKILKLQFEDFCSFGGYPGSYPLIKNKKRWESYIQNSIIETVVGKDILLHNTVKSPALFRQAFTLLSCYPAQEISYNKLLGQLQDKGNVDLIKYYIELYEGAFLFKAIHKYSGSVLRSKTSSPKIIPLCPALIHRKCFLDSEGMGRVFEAIVGSDLLKASIDLHYWSDGKYEVDYCFEHEGKLVAIEVKSGRVRSAKSLEKFLKKYPQAIPIFITKENYIKFEKDPVAHIEQFF